MKAILAKYFGATNSRPSRIKISAFGLKSKTYNIEYEDNLDQFTYRCVKNFVTHHKFFDLNFEGKVLASGVLPDGNTVFVYHRL